MKLPASSRLTDEGTLLLSLNHTLDGARNLSLGYKAAVRVRVYRVRVYRVRVIGVRVRVRVRVWVKVRYLGREPSLSLRILLSLKMGTRRHHGGRFWTMPWPDTYFLTLTPQSENFDVFINGSINRVKVSEQHFFHGE